MIGFWNFEECVKIRKNSSEVGLPKTSEEFRFRRVPYSEEFRFQRAPKIDYDGVFIHFKHSVLDRYGRE